MPGSFKFPAIPAPKDAGFIGRLAVALYACLAALVLAALAFGTPRSVDIDEAGLVNPPYTLVHDGHISYPIYGNPHAMVVHPPLHTWQIGYLWKHGLTLYYAEAVIPALLLALAICAIVLESFSPALKLSLLFGLAFTFSRMADYGATFGTRPEALVWGAWLLGIVLLEGGRMSGWKTWKLFAGSFFVVYAAGAHYYAVASLLAAVIYMWYALRDLGWSKARKPIAAIAAGGCVFGIPYLALFVIPNWREMIDFIKLSQGTGGVPYAVHVQFDVYRSIAYEYASTAWLHWPLAHGLPLVLLSCILAIFLRSYAWVFISTLPLQLFVFFFASHKLGVYVLHELMMYEVMASGAVLCLVWVAWKRIHASSAHVLFLPFGACLLAVPVVSHPGALKEASFSLTPRVNEMEIARSASEELLGKNARVAGRLGLWYASGGAYWYDVTPDLFWANHISVNIPEYFGNFDAVADSQHYSDGTSNDSHQTLSTWYRDGVLKLKGFYLGESSELKFVLLSPNPPARLSGYGFSNEKLYRFDEAPNGDYEIVAAACSGQAEAEALRGQSPFYSILFLPQPPSGAPSAHIIETAVRPYEENAAVPPRCHVIARTRMASSLADWRAMVDRLRVADPEIHFLEAIDDLPGFHGVGDNPADNPPADAVTLPYAVDINQTELSYEKASLDKKNGVNITTAAGSGLFAAAIPIHPPDNVTGPCWIDVKAQVLHGRIGMGAWSSAEGRFLSQEPVLLKSAQPIDVYLRVASPKAVTNVIVYSGLVNMRSSVQILGAGIVVPKQDAPRNSPRSLSKH